MFNFADGTIVVVSTTLQGWLISREDKCGDDWAAFLPGLRIVRLLRLFIILNRVQHARKQVKYLSFSSPLEQVTECLGVLKNKARNKEAEADLEWILHLISSDKLYSIDMLRHSMNALDSEMSHFLSENLGMQVHEAEGENASGTLQGVDSDEEDMLKSDAGGEGRKEITLVRRLSGAPALAVQLRLLHSWQVDPFQLHRLSNESGLVIAANHLFEDYGLFDKFRLSKPKLLKFFRKIQDGYRAENPYHNCVHALDVMLNTNYFLRQQAIAGLITPLDRLGALIGAAIHDHDHPGLNNAFLIAIKDELAIMYNDVSVLESHHLASAWQILMQDEYNFLRHLSREQFRELRDVVVQVVLGTDLRFHFEHYTKFKTKVASDAFLLGSATREDIKFLLLIAVHTADIANPAKPSALCLEWTRRVMEEFFRQGDLEAEKGLPISPFYDRNKTSSAQCQMGFINVLVKPLYAEIAALLGEPTVKDCMEELERNLNGWDMHGDKMLSMSAAELVDLRDSTSTSHSRCRTSTSSASRWSAVRAALPRKLVPDDTR